MKIILLITALLSLRIASAQIQALRADEVPAVVLQALHTRFPTAQKEIWEKLNEINFSVNCFTDETQRQVTFDTLGAWEETESGMTVPQLPPAAERVIQRYKGYTLDMLQKNEWPDRGISYDAILIKGTKRVDFYFSAAGKVLSKTKRIEKAYNVSTQ